MLLILTGSAQLKSDSGIRLDKGAGAAGLNQILLLVVVDIEIVEHVHSAAAIRADIVIRQINDNAHQSAAVLAVYTLHNRNGHNLLNAELLCKLSDISVEIAAGGIGQKQAVGKNVFSGVQSRLTRTLIVLAGFDSGANKLAGLVVLGSGRLDADSGLNGIQLLP